MDHHIGYLIKSINDKIKIHADADLKSHNLTLAQSRILIFLMNRGGESTQKEIEDFLEVSHPTVVGLVSRMEKSGFLICRTDEQDHRNKIVALSKVALETGKNMDAVITGMEENMLSGLSDEQKAELNKALEIIYENLN